MNAVGILHNAARRYCMQRAAECSDRYARLGAENRLRQRLSDGSWSATDEAYDALPRAHVNSAILHEVERFVPADFGSVEECRDLLAMAGETAQNNALTNQTNGIASAAIAEERKLFMEFVKSADVSELAKLAPLPFRRVLGKADHQRLHMEFMAKWGKWYGGCVDPPTPQPDVATLHVAAMQAEGSYECIRRTLSVRGIVRLFELREYDNGYEIETEAADFMYNGAEGFWTSGGMEWMVYASHEASITFGGSWLVRAVQECLPEFERYRYEGWDLSKYEAPKPRNG